MKKIIMTKEASSYFMYYVPFWWMLAFYAVLVDKASGVHLIFLYNIYLE